VSQARDAATSDPARPRHTSVATAERGRPRRDEIVVAATEMFAVEGYRGTSLARIAARVGITQAALLHHFGSKEGLLRAVVERRREQDLALGERILAGRGLEVVDRLPLLAEHNAGRAGLVQLSRVLVAENLDRDQPLHGWFVERYRRLRGLLAAAIAAGQRAGDVRADVDAAALAARIVATLEGLETQWLLEPEAVDLRASFREFAAALRRELAP
jgi:AcrR family transcriptional regulator